MWLLYKTLIVATKLTFAVSTAPPGHLQKLEQAYTALRNESCSAVLTKLPLLPANGTESFMRAYHNFTGASGEDETQVFDTASALLSLSAMDTTTTWLSVRC